MLTEIVFIINPRSGSSAIRVDVPALIHQHLDKERFTYRIMETEYAGHATELANAAAAKGVSVVCAVGGDGTVNEVARGLVSSNSALAILPRGSGNGLARHLKIPMNIPQAIRVINQNHLSRIDACTINNHPFFCTAGIGFDAQVSAVFAASLKRGLSTYVKLVWQEFLKYRPQTAQLALNGETLEANCFVVAFANASQYGNNAFIAPMADIRDGLLDVCLIRHLNLRKAIALAYGMITKTIAASGDAQYYKTNFIKIESEVPFKFHADGEFMGEARYFEVCISALALNVIVPEF